MMMLASGEGGFDALGQFLGNAGDGDQLLDGRFLDIFYRAKMVEELFAARRTDTRDHFSARGQPLFGAQVAVRGDGIAMGFIAHALDKIEALRVARQHDWGWATWQE